MLIPGFIALSSIVHFTINDQFAFSVIKNKKQDKRASWIFNQLMGFVSAVNFMVNSTSKVVCNDFSQIKWYI